MIAMYAVSYEETDNNSLVYDQSSKYKEILHIPCRIIKALNIRIITYYLYVLYPTRFIRGVNMH